MQKRCLKKLDMEQEKTENYIEYHYKNDMDYPYGYYAYILFDLKDKSWRSNLVGTTTEQEYAINKQISELGWK